MMPHHFTLRRSSLFVALLTWGAVAASEEQIETLSSASVATFPPDHGAWPRAQPEDYGWSSKKLAAARDLMCDDQGARFSLLDGIVIVEGHDIWHYGQVYALRPGLRTQHDWASCARSVMTTMYGMAF
ncbi:MAG: hypothetical protein AAF961_15655, partial [Planctomycetota bacterium]